MIASSQNRVYTQQRNHQPARRGGSYPDRGTQRGRGYSESNESDPYHGRNGQVRGRGRGQGRGYEYQNPDQYPSRGNWSKGERGQVRGRGRGGWDESQGNSEYFDNTSEQKNYRPDANNREGTKRGRGRGNKNSGGGYREMDAEENVDRSDDEDMQKFHYQQLQAKQSENSESNLADYFDDNVKAASRSNSRSKSPVAHSPESPKKSKQTDNFLAERSDDPSSIIQRAEQMSSDEDSADHFQKTLDESRIEMNRKWELQKSENAKKPKQPKKGRVQPGVAVQNRNMYEALQMDPAKNTDDQLQMDWKSRITGAIIEDYQKEYNRRNEDQSGTNPKERGPRSEREPKKGGLKFIRPKFIGLTEKFEYKNMLMSSTNLFINNSILQQGQDNAGQTVNLNHENLNTAAGFGRIPDAMAMQYRDMLMQYFRLFVMYESHYGGFKNCKPYL